MNKYVGFEDSRILIKLNDECITSVKSNNASIDYAWIADEDGELLLDGEIIPENSKKITVKAGDMILRLYGKMNDNGEYEKYGRTYVVLSRDSSSAIATWIDLIETEISLRNILPSKIKTSVESDECCISCEN